MSLRTGRDLIACLVLVGALFALAVIPGSAFENKQWGGGGGGGGGAGVGIGIDLGKQLLKKRAKKPQTPAKTPDKGTGAKKPGKDNPKPPKGQAKAAPKEEPKVEETDCVLYMQYTEKKDSEEGSIANNADIENSAKALQKKLGKDVPIEKVSPTTTIEQALAKIAAKKKCCKTLHIVSHGSEDGALDLPYDLPDPNNELTEKDKDAGALHKLGGKGAKAGWGDDRLNDLVKTLKKHLCKGGTVVFDGCWAGKEDGIAQQVAGKGSPTKGFPGWCELGPMVDEKGNKEYSPPRPGTGEHQSDPLKSFEPKAAPTKAPEKTKKK